MLINADVFSLYFQAVDSCQFWPDLLVPALWILLSVNSWISADLSPMAVSNVLFPFKNGRLWLFGIEKRYQNQEIFPHIHNTSSAGASCKAQESSV
jgi:hypothetical protein